MAVVRIFGKEYPYVLSGERDLPREKQTIWWYKVADLETQYAVAEVIEFEGDPSKSESLRTIFRPNREAEAEIIRRCLVRVENLYDEEGRPLVWPSQRPKQDEFLAVLPSAWRTELATAFRSASVISEAEAKNSV